MPSSYSASLRMTLQASGENTNTWGLILNSGAFQLLDDAIAGSVAVTTYPTTLTTAPGATDQARCISLFCTGAGGTITAPSVKKTYVVDAFGCSGDVSITTGAGKVATVPAGSRAWVYSPNSSDFYLVQNDGALSNVLKQAIAYTDSKQLQGAQGLPAGSTDDGRLIASQGGAVYWGPQSRVQQPPVSGQLSIDTVYGVDTSTTTTPLTLPALSSVKEGQTIRVRDATGTGGTNTITVNPASGDHIVYQGANAEPAIVENNGGTLMFVVAPNAAAWRVER